MITTLSYRQNLPVLHSFSGILHEVGTRHMINGREWEVVEHRDQAAYVLPVDVIGDIRSLGVTVTPPHPGGYGSTEQADKAELIRNNGHVVGMEIVRDGLRFSWIITA